MSARDARERSAPVPTGERLWTAEDVAGYLAVSERQVYNLVPLGLPTVRLPGTGDRTTLRFDPAEVRAWVAGRKSHSVAKLGAFRRVG